MLCFSKEVCNRAYLLTLDNHISVGYKNVALVFFVETNYCNVKSSEVIPGKQERSLEEKPERLINVTL